MQKVPNLPMIVYKSSTFSVRLCDLFLKQIFLVRVETAAVVSFSCTSCIRLLLRIKSGAKTYKCKYLSFDSTDVWYVQRILMYVFFLLRFQKA